MELLYYQTAAGATPAITWLEQLRDSQARARIAARLARLQLGNFGDVEPVGEGVLELRVDWGPGYRVWRAWASRSCFCCAQVTSERNGETSNVRKSTSTTTRPAQRKRRRAAASLPFEGWLVERLKDPAEAAAYLEAALEDGDQAVIMLALRQIAQAQGGVAEIARKAKLTREATYKMLSKSGNPELRSLSAVLRATGLRIAVKPIEKRPS